MTQAIQSHKSPWPRAIAGWLIFIATLNFFVLYLAQSTRPLPMSSGSPYAEGLAYEAEISAQRAFRESGLQATWTWGLPSEAKHIEVTFRSTRAQAPEIRSVKLTGLRGDGTQPDFSVELIPVKNHPLTFVGKTRVPVAPRAWLLSAEITTHDGQRLLWKGARGYDIPSP